MKSNSGQSAPREWVQNAKARGLGHALEVALDVFQPLGVIGAQLIWIGEPVLRLWIPPEALAELANALETPDGVEQLRQELED